MTRLATSLALASFLATASGCHASSVRAGRDSLGLVTLVIVGGALLVALLGFLYRATGRAKADR